MFRTPTSSELNQKTKSPQMKQDIDDRFFSRLLSKETSMASPSFRVYYNAVSVSVPFVWESQPGTPKNKSHESTLPPLTPPPSYYTNYHHKKPSKEVRPRSSNLLQLLFSRIGLFLRKSNASASTLLPTPSSVSWSSSSSSRSLLPFTNRRYTREGRMFSGRGLSFGSGVSYDEEAFHKGSPTSPLCFGVGKGITGSLGLKGRCCAFWSS